MTDSTQASIDTAAKAAACAVGPWVEENRVELDDCSPEDQVNLIVRATIAYLVSNNLATLSADELRREELPYTIAEPFDLHVNGQLVEASNREIGRRLAARAAGYGRATD